MAGVCFQGLAENGSVPTGTWTTLPITSADVDTSSFYSAGSPTRVTFPDNGLYFVAVWSEQNKENLSFGRGPRIVLNGQTTWPCGVLTTSLAGGGHASRGAYTAFCAPFRSGDYLQFQGRQDEGSTDGVYARISVVRLPTATAFCSNTLVNQTLAAANTFYDAVLPTKAFNYGGWTWDTGTSEVTVPSTGTYLIFGHVNYDDWTDETVKVAIDMLVNGSSLGPQYEKNGGCGHYYTVRSLSSGDIVRMQIRASDLSLASGATGTFNGHGLTLVKLNESVSVYGTAQAGGNPSPITVDFPSEYVDTDAYHSTVTNNSRITVPSGKAGKYMTLARFEYNTMTLDGEASLYKNNSYLYAWYICSAANAWLGNISVVDLAVSDYVQIRAGSDNSSPSLTTGHYAPEFAAIYIDGFTYDTLTMKQTTKCPYVSDGFVPTITRRNI